MTNASPTINFYDSVNAALRAMEVAIQSEPFEAVAVFTNGERHCLVSGRKIEDDRMKRVASYWPAMPSRG